MKHIILGLFLIFVFIGCNDLSKNSNYKKDSKSIDTLPIKKIEKQRNLIDKRYLISEISLDSIIYIVRQDTLIIPTIIKRVLKDSFSDYMIPHQNIYNLGFWKLMGDTDKVPFISKGDFNTDSITDYGLILLKKIGTTSLYILEGIDSTEFNIRHVMDSTENILSEKDNIDNNSYYTQLTTERIVTNTLFEDKVDVLIYQKIGKDGFCYYYKDGDYIEYD